MTITKPRTDRRSAAMTTTALGRRWLFVEQGLGHCFNWMIASVCALNQLGKLGSRCISEQSHSVHAHCLCCTGASGTEFTAPSESLCLAVCCYDPQTMPGHPSRTATSWTLASASASAWTGTVAMSPDIHINTWESSLAQTTNFLSAATEAEIWLLALLNPFKFVKKLIVINNTDSSIRRSSQDFEGASWSKQLYQINGNFPCEIPPLQPVHQGNNMQR